uniref:Uncharacterized protein n=1 Tax=Caenorhabditis japonica TaxID=281687 RepID=A0A8R1HWW4_CAEJA
MTSVTLNKDEVYLLEKRQNQELNLEHIDEEMRMEQVRQLAHKMDWASFGQAVRRNMMEKRNTLDADARIDVLKGIAYMKSKMPIDSESQIQEKFKIMAESLGCAHNTTPRGWSLVKEDLAMDFTVNEDQVTAVILSFWEEPSFYTQDATMMLQEGKWSEFRNLVTYMLSIYAKDLSLADILTCKKGMKMLEMLFKQYSTENHYTSINRNNYGYYLPRGELRPGRLYYIVEPLYRNVQAKEGKFHLEPSDHDILPYFEFFFIKHHAPCLYPEYNELGGWNNKVEANAAICLKLSKGFLMTQETRKKLGKISAKTASIRHFTNAYRHMTGEIKIEGDLKMITQFGSGIQHLYTIDKNSFNHESDSVITEIYIKDLQDFHEAINILRNEYMHMSLWESMMAMCYEVQGIQQHEVSAINMNVLLARDQFVISFNTRYAPITGENQ